MQNQSEQTLGNLINRLSKTFAISNELNAKIAEGKNKRDFLAHHYFRERATDFAHRNGRDRMIAELTEIREFFRALDKETDLLVAPIFPQLDISQERVQEYMSEYMEQARREEL